MFLRNSFLAGALVVLATGFTQAQDPSAGVGIAIDHQLTINKCGGCHPRDASGMMRRLSYMRTSPEVWEQAIKRMVRLNGLVIKPEEARDILRFLGIFREMNTAYRVSVARQSSTLPAFLVHCPACR